MYLSCKASGDGLHNAAAHGAEIRFAPSFSESIPPHSRLLKCLQASQEQNLRGEEDGVDLQRWFAHRVSA